MNSCPLSESKGMSVFELLWVRLELDCSIRSTKFVVGTQIGVLSIFNRSSGWGDCVDRIPG